MATPSRRPIPFRSPHRTPAQRQLREIEEMRASMPLGTYIELMHIAATTGAIPIMDPKTGSLCQSAVVSINEHGEEITQLLTQGHALDGAERIKLMQFLVNKIMPDVKQIDSSTQSSAANTVDAIAESEDDITQHLTGQELNQAIQDAVFYLPKIAAPPTEDSNE